MNRGQSQGFLLALVIGLLLGAAQPLPAAADNAHEQQNATQSQLKLLKKRIDALRRQLRQTSKRRKGEQGELARIEKQIGQLSTSLADLEQLLARQDREQAELIRRQAELEARLDSQRDALARLLRSAQRHDQQEYLQMLLNQDDPAQVGRLLTYYDYFNRARHQRIEELHTTRRELSALRSELESQRQRSAATREEQLLKLATLEESRKLRQQTIRKLSHNLNSQQGRLNKLKADKQQLEALLRTIQDALSESQYVLPGTNFRASKGKLRWPTQGKIIARFGEPRELENLPWQGVMLQAPIDQPVHAIAAGQVVFAEWMRGYGLLLIIDHGDGYMSLYGHNQNLHKGSGDWVRPGEVIARVGDSGGQSGGALYFEIRIKGKPSNPQHWCHD